MNNFGVHIAQEIIINELRDNNINIILDNYIDIINKLKKFNIPYSIDKVKVDQLILSNNYFDIREIINVSENINKVGPIIISNDNYVIDGLNKTILYKCANEKYIDVIKIKYPQKAVQFLFNDLYLNESTDQKVVIYSGRFQPFHKNHYDVYKELINKFGKNNVYIATSNIINKRSPFSFSEKKKIMTSIFGIPSNKIVLVKNAYAPEEILNRFKNAAYIAVIGDKDKNRLSSGKYFKPYKNNINLDNYNNHGYYYVAQLPKFKIGSDIINGSYIRNKFPKLNKKNKMDLFNMLYPRFDKNIFNMFNNILKENLLIKHFIKSNEFKNIIFENNQNWADDGPNAFFPSFDVYRNVAKERVKQVGYKILNYFINDKYKEKIDYPIYPHGPVPAVSFGPAGAAMNKLTAQNQINLKNVQAYLEWTKNIKRSIDLTGFTFIAHVNPELFISENKKILLEGGGYGHLSHPFDDMNLTFSDLKNIISLGLEGNLSVVGEKTDGQNLMFTVINGKVKAARNAGHIKNFGKTSLDLNGIKNMFAGRGAIEQAFTYAMNDLESALKSISKRDLNSIFKNGKVFMSVEIIYPATSNVIPYGLSLLVFHGTNEYDKDGNIKKVNTGGDKKLLKLINKVNSNIQKTFNIQGQHIPKIPKSKNFTKQKRIYFRNLNKLKNQFKLKDNDSILQYHIEWWKKFIEDQANKFNYSLPTNVFNSLLNRWAYNNKSYKITNIRKFINNKEFLNWMNNFDKTDYQSQLKKNIEPFEILFLKLGAQILNNIYDLLAADPNAAAQKIKQDLENTSKELEKSNDINKLQNFIDQLNKLNSIGGVESILPTEGIVFTYKGKLYKFTGTFAPVNQILGLLKF